MEHLIYRLGVTPAKAKALLARMQRLGISGKDVMEKFVRSSGRGGQKVNKASTCVYLKHLPTGIEVKMQRERSQSLNRFLAWRLLTDKIERMRFSAEATVQQTVAKSQRQTRPRPGYAKEEMLRGKKLHRLKKQLRQPIVPEPVARDGPVA
jgi:protein subunit release factor B